MVPKTNTLHPRNLTQIPKMAIFKRSHHFQDPSFWGPLPAVSFPGCTCMFGIFWFASIHRSVCVHIYIYIFIYVYMIICVCIFKKNIYIYRPYIPTINPCENTQGFENFTIIFNFPGVIPSPLAHSSPDQKVNKPLRRTNKILGCPWK